MRAGIRWHAHTPGGFAENRAVNGDAEPWPVDVARHLDRDLGHLRLHDRDLPLRVLDAFGLAIPLGDDERLFEARPCRCKLALLLVAFSQAEQGAAPGVEIVALLE